MNVKLRPAVWEDARQLFDWANEEETRKNSFSTEPILWENHLVWLQKKLADKNCLFYILTDGTQNIGTIRLDINEETKTGVISYSIDSAFRGKGLGTKILALAEEKGKEAGLLSLNGSVKVQNQASGKCFIHNGYSISEKNEKEVLYTKKQA